MFYNFIRPVKCFTSSRNFSYVVAIFAALLLISMRLFLVTFPSADVAYFLNRVKKSLLWENLPSGPNLSLLITQIMPSEYYACVLSLPSAFVSWRHESRDCYANFVSRLDYQNRIIIHIVFIHIALFVSMTTRYHGRIHLSEKADEAVLLLWSPSQYCSHVATLYDVTVLPCCYICFFK